MSDTGFNFGPNRQTGVTALGKAADHAKADDTQQADPTDAWEGLDYYRPPYSPEKLASLVEIHEAHDVAVRKKAQYVAGFGFDVAAHPHAGDSDPEDEPPESLTEFWYGGKFQLGPDRQPASASDVMVHAWTDYESVGWTAVEILTQGNGEPIGLAHVPAHTIRRVKDRPAWVQLGGDGQPTGYFGVAGERAENDIRINKDTGEGDATGDAIANELLVVRNYSALSPHYGTPDIISAVQTLSADVEARDYNTRFFENDGVPRFAVVVEGGELSERAYNDLRDKLRAIKEQENTHRGILIEAQNAIADGFTDDSDVNIRLEPLTVGVEEDASFTEFRKANREDILRSHEVPPVMAGDLPDANRSITEQLRAVFAEETIAPKQERLAERLYQAIHVAGFEEPGWTVTFTLKGADARLQEAEIASERMGAAGFALEVNEARAELGVGPLNDDPDDPVGNMLVGEITENAVVPDAERSEIEAAERARTMQYDIVSRNGEGDADADADADVDAEAD